MAKITPSQSDEVSEVCVATSAMFSVTSEGSDLYNDCVYCGESVKFSMVADRPTGGSMGLSVGHLQLRFRKQARGKSVVELAHRMNFTRTLQRQVR
jgi:hypothetical protein